MFSINHKGNSKTAIPTTRSWRGSCPSSCPLLGKSCYAENFPMVMHWENLSSEGLSYADLLDEISRLRRNTLWRHNDAGDLIGNGDTIDITALTALVEANRRRRGFTYTHWPWRANLEILKWANRNGFTINVSASDVSDALEAFNAGLPTTVILNTDGKKQVKVGGVRIIICPAQRKKHMTCAQCGICAVADRDYIIGFWPHGTKKSGLIKMVETL